MLGYISEGELKGKSQLDWIYLKHMLKTCFKGLYQTLYCDVILEVGW